MYDRVFRTFFFSKLNHRLRKSLTMQFFLMNYGAIRNSIAIFVLNLVSDNPFLINELPP